MAPHATAIHNTCRARTTPDTMWFLCPSLGASVLFLVLFAATTALHVLQGVHYRKAYCWVIAMSGLWQLLTYVFRTASIETPASFGLYAAWFVLILVAPLWTNAYAYMVLGRLVHATVPERRIWRLPAARFGLVFVLLDMVAFVVQVYGAATAAADNTPLPQVLRALHIYMAGVGIQLLFLLVCAAFALRLARLLHRRAADDPRLRPALLLLYVQFFVLLMIVIRILFRIVEYSRGLKSRIPRHEAFQYGLDTLPMFLALVAYNVVHPGRILRGPEADMPTWGCAKRR